MDTIDIPALPYVDEHTTVVAADADTVWHELRHVLDGIFSRGRSVGIVALLGCADRTPSGPRPLTESSTLRGFRVAVAAPGRELALVGRHRFSSYALVFHLEEAGPGRTQVRAETRAGFPGPAGAIYRRLVIGTGGHAFLVRRMLTTVRKRAL
ncbi:hypothetical protein [Streptomyces regalis]|uniref:DUF2867 domain-containing protein n=1 Tax=Streptomyces regalis TaxID=68262 RepID=A0A101J807_9ACTN|nr:hypothetical protein [Streptomyces regalis]KUL21888.1 hypothetical protein ADL12_43710 [Streptomyces regalis]